MNPLFNGEWQCDQHVFDPSKLTAPWHVGHGNTYRHNVDLLQIKYITTEQTAHVDCQQCLRSLSICYRDNVCISSLKINLTHSHVQHTRKAEDMFQYK